MRNHDISRRKVAMCAAAVLLVPVVLGMFGTPALIEQAIGYHADPSQPAGPNGINDIVLAASQITDWLRPLAIGLAPLVAIFGLISLHFGSRRALTMIGTSALVVIGTVTLPQLAQ